MAERLNATVLKTVVSERAPRVRIPVLPPKERQTLTGSVFLLAIKKKPLRLLFGILFLMGRKETVREGVEAASFEHGGHVEVFEKQQLSERVDRVKKNVAFFERDLASHIETIERLAQDAQDAQRLAHEIQIVMEEAEDEKVHVDFSEIMELTSSQQESLLEAKQVALDQATEAFHATQKSMGDVGRLSYGADIGAVDSHYSHLLSLASLWKEQLSRLRTLTTEVKALGTAVLERQLDQAADVKDVASAREVQSALRRQQAQLSRSAFGIGKLVNKTQLRYLRDRIRTIDHLCMRLGGYVNMDDKPNISQREGRYVVEELYKMGERLTEASAQFFEEKVEQIQHDDHESVSIFSDDDVDAIATQIVDRAIEQAQNAFVLYKERHEFDTGSDLTEDDMAHAIDAYRAYALAHTSGSEHVSPDAKKAYVDIAYRLPWEIKQYFVTQRADGSVRESVARTAKNHFSGAAAKKSALDTSLRKGEHILQPFSRHGGSTGGLVMVRERAFGRWGSINNTVDDTTMLREMLQTDVLQEGIPASVLEQTKISALSRLKSEYDTRLLNKSKTHETVQKMIHVAHPAYLDMLLLAASTDPGESGTRPFQGQPIDNMILPLSAEDIAAVPNEHIQRAIRIAQEFPEEYQAWRYSDAKKKHVYPEAKVAFDRELSLAALAFIHADSEADVLFGTKVLTRMNPDLVDDSVWPDVFETLGPSTDEQHIRNFCRFMEYDSRLFHHLLPHVDKLSATWMEELKKNRLTLYRYLRELWSVDGVEAQVASMEALLDIPLGMSSHFRSIGKAEFQGGFDVQRHTADVEALLAVDDPELFDIHTEAVVSHGNVEVLGLLLEHGDRLSEETHQLLQYHLSRYLREAFFQYDYQHDQFHLDADKFHRVVTRKVSDWFHDTFRRKDGNLDDVPEEVRLGSEEGKARFFDAINELVDHFGSAFFDDMGDAFYDFMMFAARHPERAVDAGRAYTQNEAFRMLTREGGPLFSNKRIVAEEIFSNGNPAARIEEIVTNFTQKVPLAEQLIMYTNMRLGEKLKTSPSGYQIREVHGLSIAQLYQQHKIQKEQHPGEVTRFESMIAPHYRDKVISEDVDEVPFHMFVGMYKEQVYAEHIHATIDRSRSERRKSDADRRNRQFDGRLHFDRPTAIHGTRIEFLQPILLNGNLPGESLGEGCETDAYGFHFDYWFVGNDSSIQDLKQLSDKTPLDQYASDYAGGIALIYDRSNEDAYRFGQDYHAGVRGEYHYVLLGGMPSTEVSGIICYREEHVALVKQRIVEHGCYIQIYDSEGNPLFSPEEYDSMRADGNYAVGVEVWDFSMKTGEQLGSNPGGQFTTPTLEGPTKFYVKFNNANETDHMWSEQLADNIYRAMGIAVPETQIVLVDGAYGHASRLIEGDETRNHPGLNDGFLVDVLLANWDVVMNPDNMKTFDGVTYRIDNGGSLFFRARGERVGEHGVTNFGTKSFDGNPEVPPSVMEKYVGLTEEHMKMQVEIMQKRLTDELIDSLVDGVRLSSEDRDRLRNTLRERRDKLIATYG